MAGPPCKSSTDAELPGGSDKCLGYSFAVVGADLGGGASVGFALFAGALSGGACLDTGDHSVRSEDVVVIAGEAGGLVVLSDWSFRRRRICSHPDLLLDNSRG